MPTLEKSRLEILQLLHKYDMIGNTVLHQHPHLARKKYGILFLPFFYVKSDLMRANHELNLRDNEWARRLVAQLCALVSTPITLRIPLLNESREHSHLVPPNKSLSISHNSICLPIKHAGRSAGVASLLRRRSSVARDQLRSSESNFTPSRLSSPLVSLLASHQYTRPARHHPYPATQSPPTPLIHSPHYTPHYTAHPSPTVTHPTYTQPYPTSQHIHITQPTPAQHHTTLLHTAPPCSSTPLSAPPSPAHHLYTATRSATPFMHPVSPQSSHYQPITHCPIPSPQFTPHTHVLFCSTPSPYCTTSLYTSPHQASYTNIYITTRSNQHTFIHSHPAPSTIPIQKPPAQSSPHLHSHSPAPSQLPTYTATQSKATYHIPTPCPHPRPSATLTPPSYNHPAAAHIHHATQSQHTHTQHSPPSCPSTPRYSPQRCTVRDPARASTTTYH
nr:leucine-rich repeat extensin-like protein 3 [Penaeus vannamei]